MQEFLNKYPTLARLVRLRMADWVITALVLWALVALAAPQQLPVSLYKMALVALAAVTGWWIDRSLFPYARPERFLQPLPEATQAPDAATTFTDLRATVSFTEDAAQGFDTHQCTHLGIAAMLRRALIVAATMLAVCLGA